MRNTWPRVTQSEVVGEKHGRTVLSVPGAMLPYNGLTSSDYDVLILYLAHG